MKVETPQLRWHQIINPQTKQDAGANGPILSCSLLSISDNTMGILATAGNTEVNLWRVKFTEDAARSSNAADADGVIDVDDGRSTSTTSHILVQPQTKKTPAPSTHAEHTHIEHIVTLSRGTNERSINAVKFAPSGQHLVAAGDGGTVVVWSIPNNGDSSYWSTVEKETDLPMKIIFNQSDECMDVAWSADSKRFTVCSLDHTMTVWEHFNGDWRNVHRSAKDHTHYIQGVAYDPKGVYLASMGSDRMVKVYSRKVVKDSAIKGELAKYDLDKSDIGDFGNNAADVEQEKHQGDKDKKAIIQSKVLPELLTNSTFALQNKVKTVKFLNTASTPKPNNTSDNAESNNDATEDNNVVKEASSSPAPKRHNMFVDELTLGSFFRRLAFTTDGAFLVVPAALWHGKTDNSATAKDVPSSPTSVASSGVAKLAESSFATYLFARHHFEQPYKVLTGLDKPSVVVRPNPVLFQLPPNTKANTAALPYRSIFAVLTNDTVLIYDTHHNHPLSLARGLHYAGLTDAAWSNDGKTLFVTSSDGYISILSFGNGELGDVYEAPAVKIVEKIVSAGSASQAGEAKAGLATPSEGSKQLESSGGVINTLVAKKKKKKIAPTVIAPAADSESSAEKKKVTFGEPLDDRSNQPEPAQPVINMLVGKKKKKRIAPTLVTEGAETSTTDKKRSAEEAAPVVPSTESQGGVKVNILMAKKKKKVAGSSTPVPTI